MKRIIITGFEAFAGNESNPTQDLVESLDETSELKTLILPVSFNKSWEKLHNVIKDYNPHWVISCGVAAKRESIDLERVALNFMDAGIADNDGFWAKELKISSDHPDCYMSELPLNDWKRMLEKDFPINVSLSAGGYVCNYLYFQLMSHRAVYQYQSLFIHFPYPSSRLGKDDFRRFMLEFLKII